MRINKLLTVLSCFDGISGGQIALNRAGIEYSKYYASEIDKYAIKITQANYPDTIQLGSITEWQSWDIDKPDLILAGSPCQGFSFAGKGLNFEDPRSKLFFTFVEILKHYKPKYFLLENVIMKAEHNDVISSILGEIYPECVTQGDFFKSGRLEPIEINSALVSAQNRRRLYWTNIKGITQPADRGILLKDIIEHATTEKDNCITSVSKDSLCILAGRADIAGHDYNKRVCSGEGKSPALNAASGGNLEPKIEILRGFENNKSPKIQKRIQDNICDLNGKGNCMLATLHKGAAQNGATIISDNNITWRKLTPVECERLQQVPDNYTNHVSNSRRYHALGNGWSVDVIVHIFNFMLDKSQSML